MELHVHVAYTISTCGNPFLLQIRLSMYVVRVTLGLLHGYVYTSVGPTWHENCFFKLQSGVQSSYNVSLT